MRILFISPKIPMPDRSSGDLRFFTLLKLVSESHQVTLCPIHIADQIKSIGLESLDNYIRKINSINVQTQDTDALTLIRTQSFDLVVFEFYHSARSFYVDYVRIYQPDAKIIIDSVDIHYKRFLLKASLSEIHSDLEYARTVKAQEILTYKKADLVIVVTEDDGIFVKNDIPDINIGILSNIHKIPKISTPKAPPFHKLLFIGSFKHDPNIDAVLYFCHEIFPILLKINPNFTLDVIGPDAPDSILALHSDNIIIHGFVENVEEYYRNAHIAIAPLRFGAGIKGKIGEALSFGLPVVTTEIGAEGFGLTPGENVLIAQTPSAFAEAILQLSEDHQLYYKLASNGYKFITDRFSEDTARIMLSKLVNQISLISPKRISLTFRLKFWLTYPYNYLIKPKAIFLYNSYIGWRFNHQWKD